ncbi:MAG TPA: DUF72 domain-containing protein [Candidatus Limnocylindrales bacterium]|nr:DUF72 domain-containing protein [Candidatus Limnocylindrales bacterium]
MPAATPGRLLVGTSGFSYRDWAPLFYPSGTRATEMLRQYAERLPAVELNNTFYRQPRGEAIARWLADTPGDFRFVVKAQRGASLRALGATEPSASRVAEMVSWLTAPYRLFGDRLGSVLFRVPKDVERNDDRLARLLDAWPADLPMTMELQHPSWHVDEVLAVLSHHSAALCSTDVDDLPSPDLRLTGRHLYLRLRRTTYSSADLGAWADRLRPFIQAGVDCYVFLRHDERGQSALRALELSSRVLG